MSALSVMVAAGIVVVSLAAVAFVAWRVSGWAVGPEGTTTLRVTVGIVVAVVQVVGVEIVCASLAILYTLVVMAAHLAIALVVWRRVPAYRDRLGRTGKRAGSVSAVVLGSVLAFAGLVDLQLSRRVPVDDDDVQYHLPNAVSWIQVHDLWHLPPSDPSFFTNGYPSDGELVTSWVIQPLHQLQWSAMPTMFFALAIVAGAALLAEELGGSALWGVLGGSIIVLSPISIRTQVDSALTDWASLSGLIIAPGLLLHGRTTNQWRWPILAGAALGIAVGSKDTTLLPAVILGAAALVMYPANLRKRVAVALVGGVIALAGVWFLRDALQTGNPLYPETVKLGGTVMFHGGVGFVTKYSRSVLRDLTHGDGAALRVWLESLIIWVGPALLVCAGSLVWFSPTRRRSMPSLMTAMAILWFLAYVATPYTGPGVEPFLVLSQLRYGLAALLVASVCGCVASRWLRGIAWIALGYDLVSMLVGTFRYSKLGDPGAIASTRTLLVAAVGAIVVGWWIRRPGRPSSVHPDRSRSVVTGSAALIGAIVLAAGLVALALHHRPVPSALDQALAARGESAGPVMVDGTTNLVIGLGYNLDHVLVAAGSGSAHQIAILSTSSLDQRLRDARPAAVILGPPGTPGLIPGWVPPGYHYLYTEDNERIFLKN